MIPTTMNTIATIARITAAIVRPDDLPPGAASTVLTGSSLLILTGRICLAEDLGINLPPSSQPACCQEVVYHIFAKSFRFCAQNAPAVSPGHVVHEGAEPIV